MRDYRNIWHRPVEDIEPGKVGKLDLTAEQEATYVTHGRLEIVPRTYEVVGNRRVAGVDPGKRYDAAYPIPIEMALIQGGQIAPVPSVKRSKADKGD